MATTSKKRLPRLGTPERKEAENRRACTAFWGPGGSVGGFPPDSDEPQDPIVAISAVTHDEWLESQPGSYMCMPDGSASDQVTSIGYRSSWGLLRS